MIAPHGGELVSRIVMGDEDEPVAVRAVDGRVVRFAQPGRARRDRLEHRLQVGRRPADDAQDLGGGRLLLVGFGEFPGLLRQSGLRLRELGARR